MAQIFPPGGSETQIKRTLFSGNGRAEVTYPINVSAFGVTLGARMLLYARGVNIGNEEVLAIASGGKVRVFVEPWSDNPDGGCAIELYDKDGVKRDTKVVAQHQGGVQLSLRAAETSAKTSETANAMDWDITATEFAGGKIVLSAMGATSYTEVGVVVGNTTGFPLPPGGGWGGGA